MANFSSLPSVISLSAVIFNETESRHIKPFLLRKTISFQIAIAVFAFVYGNPVRLINGYDSFGNTCGVRSNEHFTDLKLSGQNTIDKPNLFFLDIREWRNTVKICVKQCPTQLLAHQSELYRFYKETDSQLCRYDFNMSLLAQPTPEGMEYFNVLGPCPKLPVYER